MWVLAHYIYYHILYIIFSMVAVVVALRLCACKLVPIIKIIKLLKSLEQDRRSHPNSDLLFLRSVLLMKIETPLIRLQKQIYSSTKVRVVTPRKYDTWCTQTTPYYIIDRCSSSDGSIIRTWTDLHVKKIDWNVNTLYVWYYTKQRLHRKLHDTCMEFTHLCKYNKNYKNYYTLHVQHFNK